MIDPVPGPPSLNEERLASVPTLADRILYFIGCTEKLYPGINNSFLHVMDALGAKVDVTTKQSCCGGNFTAFNAAPLETVLAITQRNYNVIREFSNSCVTSCNGCFSSFHNMDAYMEESKQAREKAQKVIKDLGMEIVGDVGVFHVVEYIFKNIDTIRRRIKLNLENVSVAVHYGCHFLHQERREVIIDNLESPTIIESILEKLGATIVEYKEKQLCCGAGLNQRILHDDRINSLRITRRKMRSIASHEPDAIITVCPYCQLHLDNAQVELEVEFDDEFEIPVLHLNEILGILMEIPIEQLAPGAHKVPIDDFLEKVGYGQRP